MLRLLFGVSGGGGLPQLIIRLIEQILGMLSVTLHVPLVGLLGLDDLLEGVMAHALGIRKVRVPLARNVACGALSNSHGDSYEPKQDREREDAKSVGKHGRDYIAREYVHTSPHFAGAVSALWRQSV